MDTSPTIGALVGAIAAVMSGFRGVDKTGVNQFHRYKYASDADLLWTLKPLLAQHGISFTLVRYEVHNIATVKTAKGGEERLIDLSATYRIAHSSGEWMTVTAPGSGQDPGDKAHYKAMTGAMKYALRQCFAVPTGDDPEADDAPAPSPGRAPQPAAPATPTRGSGVDAAMVTRIRDLGLYDDAVSAHGPPDGWDRAALVAWVPGAKLAAVPRRWSAAGRSDDLEAKLDPLGLTVATIGKATAEQAAVITGWAVPS